MNKLLAGFVCATALVAGAAVPSGGAWAVGIANGSFEDGPTIPDGSFITLGSGNTSITGWEVGTGSIDYIGNYWNAQHLAHSLDLNGTTPGSIRQTINGLVVGQQYRVSFWLGGNPDSGPALKTLDVIAASINSTIQQPFSYNITGAPPVPAMNWLEAYFYFTADAPTALLTFASTVTTGGGNGFPGAYGPALDNVSIAATPLPAALPLFGTALGAFGFFSWFRRRLTATA